MGRITVRPKDRKQTQVEITPATNIIAKRVTAEVRTDSKQNVDVSYELIEDHYYLVRDNYSHLVVLRATTDMVGSRPLFVLAPGENEGRVGTGELLIIADLGTEAP